MSRRGRGEDRGEAGERWRRGLGQPASPSPVVQLLQQRALLAPRLRVDRELERVRGALAQGEASLLPRQLAVQHLQLVRIEGVESLVTAPPRRRRRPPRLLARGVLKPQPLLLRRQRLRAQPAILEVVVRLVSQRGGQLSPMSPRISHSRWSCAQTAGEEGPEGVCN